MIKLSFISLLIILVFLTSTLSINVYRKFILTYRIFGKSKRRDLHKTPIPNSSGIVFLFVFIVSLFTIESFINIRELLIIVIGAIIVCLNGFWDDLKIINPYQKLFYQFIAVAMVVYYNDLAVYNLHGFIGIGIIPYWLGFGFTIFIGLFMINSFNLIDGIDSLAGTTAILSFVAYAVLFWILNYKGYFGICVIMIGVILSYLPYNLSKKNKVLMGDSGALFIGYMLFVMSMLVVNNNEPIIDRLIDRTILPIAPMAIFILPMVDTFSVYTYRLYKGESPFLPDSYHIHHLVLAMTNSHLMASIIINLFCLFFLVVFSYLAFNIDTNTYIILFFVLFSLMVILSYASRLILRKKQFYIKK